MQNKKTYNINLYEVFHKSTNTQNKLIDKDNFTYWFIIKIINKYIKNKKRVLDIGCGAGTISLYTAFNYPVKVKGIDISKKAISKCKLTSNNLAIKNIEFEVTDFPNFKSNNTYDLIFCFEVIEHLDDDKRALSKIYKLLTKNGMLILSTPSLNAPLYKLGYAKAFDKRVGHLRRYNIEILTKMFLSHKFKIIEVKKTEGIMRNYLYLNPLAGKLIRFIRFPISKIFYLIDNILVNLFGESDIFIVAMKK